MTDLAAEAIRDEWQDLHVVPLAARRVRQCNAVLAPVGK